MPVSHTICSLSSLAPISMSWRCPVLPLDQPCKPNNKAPRKTAAPTMPSPCPCHPCVTRGHDPSPRAHCNPARPRAPPAPSRSRTPARHGRWPPRALGRRRDATPARTPTSASPPCALHTTPALKPLCTHHTLPKTYLADAVALTRSPCARRTRDVVAMLAMSRPFSQAPI
jgi:hypothetical protein